MGRVTVPIMRDVVVADLQEHEPNPGIGPALYSQTFPAEHVLPEQDAEPTAGPLQGKPDKVVVVVGSVGRVIVPGTHGSQLHVPHRLPPLGGLYAHVFPNRHVLDAHEPDVNAGNEVHDSAGANVVVVVGTDLQLHVPGLVGFMFGVYAQDLPAGHDASAHCMELQALKVPQVSDTSVVVVVDSDSDSIPNVVVVVSAEVVVVTPVAVVVVVSAGVEVVAPATVVVGDADVVGVSE